MNVLRSFLSCRKLILTNVIFRINAAATTAALNFRLFSTPSRTGFDNYEKERASWNVKVPEKFNFASDVLNVWAQKERIGQRSTSIPAFWFVYENGEELKWNFQDLERETKRAANMLENQCGVKRGDNVMVMLPKVPEFWLVNIAALRIGFILSPASMQLTSKDLSYRFSALKPSCIIADETKADSVDEAAEFSSTLKTKIIVSSNSKLKERKGWLDFHHLLRSASSDHKCADTSSDESMMVFFTSGTTGQPKMVEHSHGSYGIGLVDTGKYWQDLTSENILWNMSDTGWAKTAYSNIFAPWSCGSCVFVHQMVKYSPSLTLEVLSSFPIDTLCAPPLVYRTIVQEDANNYRFCKLSHCLSAGEALGPETIKQWTTITGMKIYEGYGQTETVLLIGMFKCLEYRAGSIGKPAPGIDIVIIDENGNELHAGMKGEIAVKRNGKKIFGLFSGYKNEPNLTLSRFTDKYFHTGDIGYFDEDGYYWFVGRNDDLINSAGYRIGPFEVESALMEHPCVTEVAVTSSPDTARGEVVKAFIVLKDSYSHKNESDLIEELQDHAKRVTAPYKYPRKIEFVKELPKTASGKVKRFEIKKKEWDTWMQKANNETS